MEKLNFNYAAKYYTAKYYTAKSIFIHYIVHTTFY